MCLHTCKTHMQTNMLEIKCYCLCCICTCTRTRMQICGDTQGFFLAYPLFIYVHISRCGVATMSKPPNCQVSLAREPRKNRGCWEKSWNTSGAYQSTEIKCNHVCFMWTCTRACTHICGHLYAPLPRPCAQLPCVSHCYFSSLDIYFLLWNGNDECAS